MAMSGSPDCAFSNRIFIRNIFLMYVSFKYRVLFLGKGWKRMVTKVTYVGEGFTRKPPKYERFIRPMVSIFRDIPVNSIGMNKTKTVLTKILTQIRLHAEYISGFTIQKSTCDTSRIKSYILSTDYWSEEKSQLSFVHKFGSHHKRNCY